MSEDDHENKVNTVIDEGSFENPHKLTLSELEEAKEVMGGLLAYVFKVGDRRETRLTVAELGENTTEGLVRLDLDHDRLTELYNIGASMGMNRETLEGLSNDLRWKELFLSPGRPQKDVAYIGFGTGSDSSGSVG